MRTVIMSGRNNLFSSEGEDWEEAVLSAMRDSTLSDALVYSILRQIREENKNNGCSEKEQEQIQAIEQLQKRLTRTQLSAFGIIEQLYMKEATMCLQTSFPRGIYAAFQHRFDSNEECTFERLVMEPLESGESMEQFPEISKNKSFRNELLEELTTELRPTRRKQLTAYSKMWDERIKGVMRYGFRLGYAAAQSIILDVEPPQT
jgi:hypothetical protein